MFGVGRVVFSVGRGVIQTGRVGWTAVAVLVVGGAISAGCGQPEPSSSQGSAAAKSPTLVTVHVKNTAFDPTSVDVPAGGKVVWSFEDAGIPHTVTSDTNAFGSPPNGLTSGTFEHVFARAGSYAYHCDFHPAMTATVNVH